MTSRAVRLNQSIEIELSRGARSSFTRQQLSFTFHKTPGISWQWILGVLLAIFGVLHLFTIPAVGMGLLLAGALLVAVRYRRRRALQKWLNTQSFEIHASDLGDHLRLACLLKLEPLEAVHLLHWRVALVYAAEISNFPWVIDVAALEEVKNLNQSLALGDTLELKCVLPVPKEWLEEAFIEGGSTTDDMGWFVRVELTFGSSLVWVGVTQPVDSLEQLHKTGQ